MTAFYTTYNQDKIASIPKVIKKYDNPEKIEELFVKLVSQYGVEETDPFVRFQANKKEATIDIWGRVHSDEEIESLGPVERKRFDDKKTQFVAKMATKGWLVV